MEEHELSQLMQSAHSCCGTCRYWNLEDERLTRLGIGRGICRLAGKERKAHEMTGCLGWKSAGPAQLEHRLKNGLIEINHKEMVY